MKARVSFSGHVFASLTFEYHQPASKEHLTVFADPFKNDLCPLHALLVAEVKAGGQFSSFPQIMNSSAMTLLSFFFFFFLFFSSLDWYLPNDSCPSISQAIFQLHHQSFSAFLKKKIKQKQNMCLSIWKSSQLQSKIATFWCTFLYRNIGWCSQSQSQRQKHYTHTPWEPDGSRWIKSRVLVTLWERYLPFSLASQSLRVAAQAGHRNVPAPTIPDSPPGAWKRKQEYVCQKNRITVMITIQYWEDRNNTLKNLPYQRTC